MILSSLLSLLITTAVITAVALLVRWAIREGEGDDPRWGLTGQLDPDSPLSGFAERAYAVPEARVLTLRGSRRRETAWEKSYPWRRVSLMADPPLIVLIGPFGRLSCPVPDDIAFEEAVARFDRAEPATGTVDSEE